MKGCDSMKIEKINDNQIRCTLNKEDLLDRELRISELAYGTEKAKALFRDMMQQASYEFGFEAEDIPLMIEAIPVSPDCLILVITKVEDPDELDTRFSKFTSSSREDSDFEEEEETPNAFADEIINCFDELNNLLEGDTGDIVDEKETQDNFIPLPDIAKNLKQDKQKKEQEKSKPVSIATQTNIAKIFSFHSLEEVIHLAKHVSSIYRGQNSLYKNPADGKYLLVLNKSNHTPEEFNKLCNIVSEFARPERTTYASHTYYQEHFYTIVKDQALNILSAL